MNVNEAKEIVWRAVRRIAPEVEPGEIDPDAELRTQIEIDSMDFLNIVQAIYDETGVDIPERDYPRLGTVNALAEYVSAAPAAGRTPA
jgi:acyl carrier protein